jgi:hypothetical protein
MYNVYRNTPENAKRIGWSYYPEYCVGDANAPFVLHNHHDGHFYYLSAEARTARDPMCYPQLDPRRDFEPDLTYAQRLRNYIEFVVNDETLLHEDPTVVIIY